MLVTVSSLWRSTTIKVIQADTKTFRSDLSVLVSVSQRFDHHFRLP